MTTKAVQARLLATFHDTPGDTMENEPILQFFKFAHLPEKMQAVSRPFCELASSIVETLPRNPERTVALRKLLEAKDAAVRAGIFVALMLFLLPSVSFAQALDGGVGPALPTNLDTASLTDFLPLLLSAGGSAKWALLVVLVLMAATVAIRHYGSKLPGAIGTALGSPAASWALPLVFSTCGALGVSLSNGQPLTLNTLLGALLVGLGAGGVLAKQLGAPKVAAAEAAGVAAVGSSTASKDDKVTEIGGGK